MLVAVEIGFGFATFSRLFETIDFAKGVEEIFGSDPRRDSVDFLEGTLVPFLAGIWLELMLFTLEDSLTFAGGFGSSCTVGFCIDVGAFLIGFAGVIGLFGCNFLGAVDTDIDREDEDDDKSDEEESVVISELDVLLLINGVFSVASLAGDLAICEGLGSTFALVVGYFFATDSSEDD
jgi:hypothetical protein